MDQSNNIAAAFNRLWGASTLPGLVPGGLQWSHEHMKAGKIPARPYAQVWVTLEGDPQCDSGLSYWQAYRVELKVWCGADNTVLKSVDSALESLLPFSTKLETTGFLTENARTIDVQTMPAGIDQEESRASQQNIGLVIRRWRVALNETRSAA